MITDEDFDTLLELINRTITPLDGDRGLEFKDRIVVELKQMRQYAQKYVESGLEQADRLSGSNSRPGSPNG